MLKTVARAIAKACPDIRLMVVLVGERPGEKERAAVVRFGRALAALGPQPATGILTGKSKTGMPNGSWLLG